MEWLVKGDIHGDINFLKALKVDPDIENCNIIVLGDFGANYFKDWRDERFKDIANSIGCRFYVVRGNHEMRPKDVDGMDFCMDADVHGLIFYEKKYPNIRYFDEWGIYNIGGYNCGVIGGAYSVDKNYRIEHNLDWFSNEQLSAEERAQCRKDFEGFEFDFIFSHTCPYKWRPTDKFLGFIDQSTVDTSMELWMQSLVDSGLKFKAWLWAHYHIDRIERPRCEIYYKKFENLDVIYNRWINYDNTGELDWYLEKGPMFYAK